MTSIKGVLFLKNVDGEMKWVNGDSGNEGKYEGEIENWKPNGIGNITYLIGIKYVGNGRMVNIMVKEHLLYLMVRNMLGNGKMVKDMVKEYSLYLMDGSILGNGRMGNNMVKEHTLGLMETSM